MGSGIMISRLIRAFAARNSKTIIRHFHQHLYYGPSSRIQLDPARRTNQLSLMLRNYFHILACGDAHPSTNRQVGRIDCIKRFQQIGR